MNRLDFFCPVFVVMLSVNRLNNVLCPSCNSNPNTLADISPGVAEQTARS